MQTILCIAQILLAIFFISGAIMKFMSIEKISKKMPWMGQVPPLYVRLLGILDLICAAGLILPTLLNIKSYFIIWTAIGIVAYMACAIIFHISRGEKSVIGVNIFIAILALFLACGLYY